jgi:hypothetical protein
MNGAQFTSFGPRAVTETEFATSVGVVFQRSFTSRHVGARNNYLRTSLLRRNEGLSASDVGELVEFDTTDECFNNPID